MNTTATPHAFSPAFGAATSMAAQRSVEREIEARLARQDRDERSSRWVWTVVFAVVAAVTAALLMSGIARVAQSQVEKGRALQAEFSGAPQLVVRSEPAPGPWDSAQPSRHAALTTVGYSR